MSAAPEWLAPAVARSVGGLLATLPLPVSRRLARSLARAYFAVNGRRVHWTLQNLSIAFPSWAEEDRVRVARESAENLALNTIDLFRSVRWNQADLLRRFRIEGLENLTEALAGGRGAVLLSLHMGCYDVGLRALSVRAPWLRIAAIARPLGSSLTQDWISRRRSGGNVELIALGVGAALRALRALRQGRPLVILADLHTRGSRSAQLPLFGKRCLTPLGPAALAARVRAPLLPCYVIRDAPDHHVVHILPQVRFPAGSSPGDQERRSALCNAVLEEIIRKHPEHWVWGHRRFRHSVDLPRGIYRRAHSGR